MPPIRFSTLPAGDAVPRLGDEGEALLAWTIHEGLENRSRDGSCRREPPHRARSDQDARVSDTVSAAASRQGGRAGVTSYAPHGGAPQFAAPAVPPRVRRTSFGNHAGQASEAVTDRDRQTEPRALSPHESRTAGAASGGCARVRTGAGAKGARARRCQDPCRSRSAFHEAQLGRVTSHRSAVRLQ